MRIPRALILLAFTSLLAALLANGGIEALLTVLPLVGLVALLVCGRYVGEEQILRRYATPPRAARRRAVALPRPSSARVRSVYARSALTRRGPPAAVLA